MDKVNIDESLQALENWFDSNGLAGYDPFDAKGHPLLINIQKYSIPRGLVNLVLEGAPRSSRFILRIRPAINAKAMALLTLAYVNRYETTGDSIFLDKASRTGKWLIEQGETWDNTVVGWGYPFDWQSRVLIPRGTPSSVVTAFGLQALIALCRYRPEMLPENYFSKIGLFFKQHLNRSDEGCFSYTPLDDFRVHNANLFSVYCIMKIGQLIHFPDIGEHALQALTYTVDRQGSNGEFGYWGDEDDYPIIDHYHTGFVIRMLSKISGLMENSNLSTVIDKAVHFYCNSLFENDFPKDQIGRVYPVNIHSLSEMLLVYCELPQYQAQLQTKLEKTLDFLIHKMQYKPGHFAYKHYPYYKVRIPFLRWNQAWVYYALTELEKIYY